MSISVEFRTRSIDRFNEKEANEQSAKVWVPPGTPVTVAGRELPDGMVYVGTTLRALQGYGRETDPALINPQLEARAKRPDRTGQHLDYWPSYTDIPRSSRAAYLDWLATGRRNPDVAVGYVFLFFYGLERRILLDMQQNEAAKADLPMILSEIEALREVYADKNGSFDGYSRRLVEFARLAYGGEGEVAPGPSETSGGYGLGLADKVALGRLISEGTPLPPAWALAWLRGSLHHRLNTPGRRCREAFDQLFTERYEERFGEGLHVEEGGPALRATYRPASSALRETRSVATEGIVDVDRRAVPEELSGLAGEVEAALDSYSRWVGRRDDRSSLAALGQLPPSLIRDRAGEAAEALIGEVEGKLAAGDYAVVPSAWITERWPSKSDGRLTKTEAEGLAGFLAGFGYGIEPDVRFARNPSKRDYVTLFRLDGDDETPSDQFKHARLLLHLASAVASADEEVAESEERHIEERLEEGLDLTRAERRRLRAYLEQQLAHPPTLRGVRRRAEKLSRQQRRRLATFLLSLAGADGQLRGEELRVLEKIYDILGFDADQVHQDLHGMAARSPGRKTPREDVAPDSGPVTVIEAEAGPDEYAIPGETELPEEASGAPGGFTLDLGRVKDVQDETRDVAQVLGDVFEEDEEEDEPFSIHGLSAAREALIAGLRAQPSWTREAFDRLAEKHGLMPGFALEEINEVAFERAGEPLLEGEDPIELNPHALEALLSQPE